MLAVFCTPILANMISDKSWRSIYKFVVLQKSAHGRSALQIRQRGGHSFECFAFNQESVPMSCLQRLDTLKAFI